MEQIFKLAISLGKELKNLGPWYIWQESRTCRPGDSGALPILYTRLQLHLSQFQSTKPFVQQSVISSADAPKS